MAYLDAFDFERTIRDYEFTRKARQQILRVVTSESFAQMDPGEIFSFILNEMQMVSFKEYLKRYLYERAEIREPFHQVPDAVYLDVIKRAFEENNAPHSFEPATTRFTARVKSWLLSEHVRRSTIFLLGFGLRMTAQDVQDFLTKVLKEDGFHDKDPAETVFQYCYLHGLPYAKAQALLRQYEALPPKAAEPAILHNSHLNDEASLLAHLAVLKGKELPHRDQDLWQRVSALYARCQQAIAAVYTLDAAGQQDAARRDWQAEDIGPADLEQMLYSGIPLSESGNLRSATLSLLSRKFQSFRLTRQRLNSVLKQKLRPDRFDLLTLLFFLYSQADLEGKARLRAFQDEANEVLEQCGFSQLHPANPYEAFLMICVLSDCPLAMFNDVWEIAYA